MEHQEQEKKHFYAFCAFCKKKVSYDDLIVVQSCVSCDNYEELDTGWICDECFNSGRSQWDLVCQICRDERGSEEEEDY